jgi:predicted porin
MEMYKKKLIAVAISAAFGLPLVAQAQTNVTIYGKLYPQINRAHFSGASPVGTPVSTLSAAATGAADFNTVVMESSNSRLGFRGIEDLGGNLKALFQLETAFAVDDGTLGATNTLFSRDTFVGLAGGFGTIKLGKMDTVYKNLGDTLSFLGISSGNFVSISNVLSKQGFGTSSSSSFHLRRNNSIIYESPALGGVQALFDYSLGEQPGSISKGSLISAGVKYETGPVYVALAHEVHKDFFGGSINSPTGLRNGTGSGSTFAPAAGAGSKDRATRLTGQYKFGTDTRVEANVARVEFKETGGATGRFESYKHTTWSLGAEQRIGATTLAASYGQAGAGTCSLVGGAVCSTAGLEGKQINLGASYALSKRTQLFAIASKMINGESARYNNASVASPDPGADITQVALGISHTF